MTSDWTRPGEIRVAVAGDWHGNRVWAKQVLTVLGDECPDVRTVLHVGDFGILPGRTGKGFLTWIDHACTETGIDQILVTPGNHEDWARLHQRFSSRPGEAIQLSPSVWVLPRGFRFLLAARLALSFGGAVSVDRDFRTEGRDWWSMESPTDEDVDQAVDGGLVDIMISHDAIHRGTHQVRTVLETQSSRWPLEAILDSEASRLMVSQVWDAVRPRVLAHGHYHVQGEVELSGGRWVYSLAADRMRGNLAILNLADLSWTWVR